MIVGTYVVMQDHMIRIHLVINSATGVEHVWR